jgi:hypothetical protein
MSRAVSATIGSPASTIREGRCVDVTIRQG